ncbi:hypothetical protein IVB18_01185 [Bradyrhizobium sp. 186]|uniref:hypothetical protein n=1 Tax=Bradyrhizobium sp. 186 TaxID=2782654 RepID=UPI00200175CB|nr:hypothetical protein [Bradyrhizobium sp. 186]UPK36029.1 hypothetical protein IVB18_01185 [Bradyrhizobium sp. 186]
MTISGVSWLDHLYRRRYRSAHPIPARGLAHPSPLVIPGRDNVANYDAQLRIRESISPPTLTFDGFRACTASRCIPE